MAISRSDTLRLILALVLVALVLLAADLWLLNPRLGRHDRELTIIETRLGELDVNHMTGQRVTI